MAGWDLLLGAALEAVLGVLATAGFGDEANTLKERLTRRSAKARQAAFDHAFRQAAETIDEANLSLLLDHPPFQEAVVAGLLDPVQGFDVAAQAAAWQSRLSTVQPLALRRFFSALENALLADETWGPILERYQNLRFRQDVMAALQARDLDVPSQRLVATVNSHLTGSGATGAGGVAVGGDVLSDVVQAIIQRLVVERVEVTVRGQGPPADPIRLEKAYLRRVMVSSNALPLAVIDPRAVERTRQRTMDLLAVYVALDTRTLVNVEGEDEEKPRQHRGIEPGQRLETRQLTALEAAALQRWLVLLGDPGSGKSTFASYLALCLAGGRLERLEGSSPPGDGWLAHLELTWGHGPLLPLQVVLRHFARSDH